MFVTAWVAKFVHGNDPSLIPSPPVDVSPESQVASTLEPTPLQDVDSLSDHEPTTLQQVLMLSMLWP